MKLFYIILMTSICDAAVQGTVDRDAWDDLPHCPGWFHAERLEFKAYVDKLDARKDITIPAGKVIDEDLCDVTVFMQSVLDVCGDGRGVFSQLVAVREVLSLWHQDLHTNLCTYWLETTNKKVDGASLEDERFEPDVRVVHLLEGIHDMTLRIGEAIDKHVMRTPSQLDVLHLSPYSFERSCAKSATMSDFNVALLSNNVASLKRGCLRLRFALRQLFDFWEVNHVTALQSVYDQIGLACRDICDESVDLVLYQSFDQYNQGKGYFDTAHAWLVYIAGAREYIERHESIYERIQMWQKCFRTNRAYDSESMHEHMVWIRGQLTSKLRIIYPLGNPQKKQALDGLVAVLLGAFPSAVDDILELSAESDVRLQAVQGIEGSVSPHNTQALMGDLHKSILKGVNDLLETFLTQDLTKNLDQPEKFRGLESEAMDNHYVLMLISHLISNISNIEAMSVCAPAAKRIKCDV